MGTLSGSKLTAMPNRMRWVRWAAAAATINGADITENSGAQWRSANHAVAKPKRLQPRLCRVHGREKGNDLVDGVSFAQAVHPRTPLKPLQEFCATRCPCLWWTSFSILLSKHTNTPETTPGGWLE